MANPAMRGMGSPEAAAAAATFGLLTALYGADAHPLWSESPTPP